MGELADYYDSVGCDGENLLLQRQTVIDFRRSAYAQMDTLMGVAPGMPQCWEYSFCDLFHEVAGESTEYSAFSNYEPSKGTTAQKAWDWHIAQKPPFSLAKLIFRTSTTGCVGHLVTTHDIKAIRPKWCLLTQMDGQIIERLRVDSVDWRQFTEASMAISPLCYEEDILLRDVADVAEGYRRFHVMAAHIFCTKEDEDCWFVYLPYRVANLKTYSGTAFGVKRKKRPSVNKEDIELLVHYLKPLSDHWARFAHLYQERIEINRHRTTAHRAAVFARNFSHVIGSHVVSNPTFREALAGPLPRGEVDAATRGFDRVLGDYLRRGFDVNPREFWEKGRSALHANHQHFRAGGALLGSSRDFHEYLQGRFDYIARAIDETKDQPEPVFFVSDLLDGFLKQSAFLHTFVFDLGLRLPDINFKVELPDPAKMDASMAFHTKWEPQRDDANQKPGGYVHRWENANKNPGVHAGADTGSIYAYDVLVGLPGGMVSAHAFYSLLENLIRNSVKYSRADQSAYELTISLTDNKDASGLWHIELADDWSKPTGAVFEDIKIKLEAPFIDSEGKPQRHGLGLLEMQACAKALYESDPANLRLKNRSPESKPETPEQLTYKMTLRQPLLVAAIVAPQTGAISDDKWKRIGRTTARGDSIEALAKQGRGAHLAMIDGDKMDVDRCLTEVTDYHPMLPYRMLVVCETDSRSREWKVAINAKVDSGEIPRNRVLFCWDEGGEIHKLAFPQTTDPKDNFEAEKQIALRCYEAWLRAWKSDELAKAGNECHLWIGLEREAQQVEEIWLKRLTRFGGDPITKDSFVKIAVRSYASNTPGPIHHSKETGLFEAGEEKAYWDEAGRQGGNKLALVFDNHGRCFPEAGGSEKTVDFRGSTRFYQKLSGTETPDLFRLLTHPPSSDFGFAFFIYGLVEACLANVMVVDERVAADLLLAASDGAKDRSNPYFAQALASHQKAGVFPVFTFRPEDGAYNGHYTAQHARAFAEVIKDKRCEGDAKQEGVRFPAEKGDASLTLLASALLRKTKADAPDEFEQGYRLQESGAAEALRCDVLVIHEGALDLLADAVGWDKNKHCESLLKISPAIIRTSGRGRESKRFKAWVPFIEFSEVSSALLTARNKFSLVRGLLGATSEHPMK